MKTDLPIDPAVDNRKLQSVLPPGGIVSPDLIWTCLSTVFAPRKLAIWAILSFTVSIAGPFGTFGGMVWPLRLAYWAVLIGLSIPVHAAIRLLTDRKLASLSFWSRSAVMGLVFSGVFTPMVWLLTKPLEDRGMVELVPFWVMLLVNLLASGMVRAVQGLWRHELMDQTGAGPVVPMPPAPLPVNAAVPEPEAIPRLLQRLDQGKRGTMQHLSVRDHYVVVQTDQGCSTLLMRFADALGELDGIDGMRVHRSHWVARGAVAGQERIGGKLHLRLRDGKLVPVSKSYRDAVEARRDA